MIRVTSVLPFDPKCDPETLEEASLRGTAVHMACEIYDLNKFFGEPPLDMSTVDPVVLPYLEGWWKFLDETGFVPTHIEHEVISEKYGYAGKIDRAGLINSRDTILDIKSGVQVKPDTWGIQLSAYLNAWCEQHEEDIHGLQHIAVQLTKEATYKIHKYDNPLDFTVFLAFLTIRKWEESS